MLRVVYDRVTRGVCELRSIFGNGDGILASVEAVVVSRSRAVLDEQAEGRSSLVHRGFEKKNRSLLIQYKNK